MWFSCHVYNSHDSHLGCASLALMGFEQGLASLVFPLRVMAFRLLNLGVLRFDLYFPSVDSCAFAIYYTRLI